MINWLFGGNDNDNEDNENSSDIKPEDLGKPEFWESNGIKPIVVDENDPKYIDKVTDQVTERINQVVEELKKDK